MLDLKRIQYFVTLFQEGSMTKAARRLNVVQPALSNQITRLEAQFKAKLFERTSRGVQPTAVARNFYRQCLQILENVDTAEHYLRESSGKVTGKLTIGVMPSLATSVVASVIQHYNDRYPDVRLHVLEGYSGTLMEWLTTGALDFAVINRESTLNGISCTPLIQDHLVLVTNRQMLRKFSHDGYPALRLPDLKLVLPSTRQGMRRLLDALLMEANVQVEPQVELDSMVATLDLVRNGDWATVLPVTAAQRAVQAKYVRAFRIVEPDISREMVVAYHAQRPPRAAGQYMIDLLKQQLEELLSGQPS